MPIAASLGASVLVFAIVVLWLSVPLVCALKGKWWFALFGLAGGYLGLVGAIRLAKPDSYWARHWYGEAKTVKAERRFPRPAVEPAPRHAQDSGPWPDDDPAAQDRITRRALRRQQRNP
jgi:hypothetical protein